MLDAQLAAESLLLAWKKHDTPSVEALEGDLEAVARAIVLVEPSFAASPASNSSSWEESLVDIQLRWLKNIALTGDGTTQVACGPAKSTYFSRRTKWYIVSMVVWEGDTYLAFL